MNKLEERHYLLTNQQNCVIEAKAHAAITKEVAIGFLNWLDDQTIQTKQHTDEELFEMYINTLK